MKKLIMILSMILLSLPLFSCGEKKEEKEQIEKEIQKAKTSLEEAKTNLEATSIQLKHRKEELSQVENKLAVLGKNPEEQYEQIKKIEEEIQKKREKLNEPFEGQEQVIFLQGYGTERANNMAEMNKKLENGWCVKSVTATKNYSETYFVLKYEKHELKTE